MTCFILLAERMWNRFVSERKPGWKNLILLFAICSSVSLAANTFLFLAGYSLLKDYPTFTAVLFSFLWIVLTFGLCFFKYLRCFASLFFLSCGMREGRNTLIAAGTGALVAGHIRNIFYNLKQLAGSISCILETQRLSFLSKYTEAIWWIYGQSKVLGNPFKYIVVLEDKLNVSYSVSDEDWKVRLNETRMAITNVTSQISSVLAVQTSLVKKVPPLLGTAFIILGTYLFIRKFQNLHKVKFKNIYITKAFIRYDEQQRQQRKLSVLPLSKEERKVYATVPSFCQTHKERKCIAYFFIPVVANVSIWTVFAAVDYLLYWLIFSVSKHLQDFPELEVHVKLYYHKNAGKFIFSDGEIAANKTSFKIPVFEHACIPTPVHSLSETWIQLGPIIFFLIVLGLLTSMLTQLKILVMTSFFPTTDMKRIEYLHAKLLKRRSKLSERNVKRKLNSFATLHFWFPILQAMRSSKKKEKDVSEDSNI
ncbi:dendritic cell-specific transmembrane protein [Pogona vitticeps]